MEYSYNDVKIPESLKQQTGLPEDVLKVLAKRGFTTKDSINELLQHDFNTVLCRTNFKDMDVASTRIAEAVRNKEKIVIYSDYDCDGICSGSIAMEALTGVKADVSYYANERTVDGYGLCVNGINAIMKQWPTVKLIITVDNGILAFDGIAYAKSQGLSVVVTDHHEANEELPIADAVVNPKRRDETYPMREICGATIIFKVMLEVYKKLHCNPAPVLDTIDLVASATVADVMPLLDENRAIVREGLKVMAEGRRGFFKAFLSNNAYGAINSDTLGFQVGPMLNAVSRMGADISIAFNALLAKDMQEALPFYEKLCELNESRKAITRDFKASSYEKAKLMIDAYPDIASIVMYCPDIPSGIVGIIAGDICSRLQRPTVILTESKGTGLIKGSARSCGDFNLKESFDKISTGVLAGYGGHAMAAGLGLELNALPQFSKELENLAQAVFASGDGVRATEIDIVVNEDSCTEEYVTAFRILEPFGEGFPTPLFGLRADITGELLIGKEQQHIKYTSKSGLQILKWNFEHRPSSPPSKFVGTPRVGSFRGESFVQFIMD